MHAAVRPHRRTAAAAGCKNASVWVTTGNVVLIERCEQAGLPNWETFPTGHLKARPLGAQV